MTDEEFGIKNGRRIDLIEKMHGGFTKEERARRFDQHPGWQEECDRRHQANLSKEEREELATLQEEVSAFLEEKYPLGHLPELPPGDEEPS